MADKPFSFSYAMERRERRVKRSGGREAARVLCPYFHVSMSSDRFHYSALASSTLGIDIGTYATRRAIWRDCGKFEHVLHISRDGDKHQGRFPDELSSKLYIAPSPAGSGSRRVYRSMSQRLECDEWTLSAKFAFYALLEGTGVPSVHEHFPTRTVLDTIPGWRDADARERNRIKCRLRRSIINLLTTIRDDALLVCEDRPAGQELCITRIGLTIPIQWTLEFEDLYRQLVTEVFGEKVQINFFTETEVLMQYIFRFHRDRLLPRSGDLAHREPDSVLTFDFGGHTMSGGLYAIVKDFTQQDAAWDGLVQVGNPFGAFGGSETWELYVLENFRDGFEKKWGSRPTLTQCQNFLNIFHGIKECGKKVWGNITTYGELPRPEGGAEASHFRFEMTASTLSRLWKKAMVSPFQRARKEMEKLRKRVTEGVISAPMVVISGGTAKHPDVKKWMENLCKAHNVPVLFTSNANDFSMVESSKVAMAAAYVAAHALDVQHFFQRGAAIGLQIRNSSGVWAYESPVLLEGAVDKNNLLSYPVEFRSAGTGKCALKLVVDVLYGRNDGDQGAVLSVDRTYDLLYLGDDFKRGTWIFQLRMKVVLGKDTLLLVKRYQITSKNKSGVFEEEVLQLPVYIDGSSNCLQVGDPHLALSELNLGIPPQPAPEETDDEDEYPPAMIFDL